MQTGRGPSALAAGGNPGEAGNLPCGRVSVDDPFFGRLVDYGLGLVHDGSGVVGTGLANAFGDFLDTGADGLVAKTPDLILPGPLDR